MRNSKSNDLEMHVIKRNGKKEVISFDKILKRIKSLGKHFNLQHIIFAQLAMKVIDQLYDNIQTTKIDELTAEQCASMSSVHPDYTKLASAIVVSNLHKNTSACYYETVKKLYDYRDSNNNSFRLIHDDIMNIVEANKAIINSFIDYERDYAFDFFGFKTLERAYLMRCNKIIVERPQHMLMRVALTIHGSNMDKVKETYDYMSQKYFIHATPTLFNAGTPRPQLSSCYLLSMEDDSIEGIFNTLKECAQISKWSGGIGLHVHNIRSSGAYIRGTNGTSNGLIPMLGVFNKTARYVDQGGKRNGSFAIYIEPHHPDIEDFLDLKKNHGDEESKCRDLFYALWISDLFMERVMGSKVWSLFCPDKCPGLSDCHSEAYRELYLKYEDEGKFNKQINARDLWIKILDSQMETGTPYILYKDAANSKSNQKNLGTIKSSNLCTEIIEYSDSQETAVCNLASLGLPMYISETKTFDYEKLYQVVQIVVANLNNVIDINYYPTPKTKRSNFKHRPIGIGVQGLADVFFKMDLAFVSDEAKEINIKIFETIYYAALEKSMLLSKQRLEYMRFLKEQYYLNNWTFISDDDECREYNIYNVTDASIHIAIENDKLIERALAYVKPIKAEIDNLDSEFLGAYSSFKGSPASYGELQFDLWNVTPSSGRYDWAALKEKIMTYGIRNSLLVAPMPTASTSQILGNNECFEPITSNIYSRKTLAGDFVLVNKYLVEDLLKLGLWNEDLKNSIIANKGSVSHIQNLVPHLKEKYKTVWELPMKEIINMSRDRGAYICQSQSLNLWIEDPDSKILTSMHFYSWKAGLKTGIYYLRRKAKHQAQQFTIEPKNKGDKGDKEKTDKEDDEDDKKECLMCSG
uniref:ribonucleoside-diphosphate reductase n=1 Tax=viral metagenome TaxID=1070528 RepID=A0A6C0D4N6_9ZZZZ